MSRCFQVACHLDRVGFRAIGRPRIVATVANLNAVAGLQRHNGPNAAFEAEISLPRFLLR
jgi:hypothetical protein